MGFEPRALLVTGGAGFIGSALVRLLDSKYTFPIIVLDILDACSNVRNLESTSPRVSLVRGDVCDTPLVTRLLAAHSIDAIIHFAAQTHVDRSFGNSFGFAQNNIIGTLSVLEAARACSPQVQRIIHVSTDEVYGETPPGEQQHFREADSPLRPTNPYAGSKAAAEMMVKAFQRSYNLPIIITRGNNVYGPCQHPEKLVPKFVCCAIQNRALPVHGTGQQQRGYVHVDDAASAFELLLMQGDVGAIYNVSSVDELSVMQIAHDICRIAGRDPHAKRTQDRLFQDRRYLVDNSKLVSLGWRPRVEWEQGLRATFAWYAAHQDYWGETDAALQPHYDAKL